VTQLRVEINKSIFSCASRVVDGELANFHPRKVGSLRTRLKESQTS